MPWGGYALSLAAVIGLSLVIAAVIAAFQLERLSILYLIVVLAVATRLGRGPAIFASLAAFLIYDWAFTEPYHQLAIDDPDEWLSLGLFLLTALVAGELAANERARSEQAKRREREASLLFDTLRLLGGPDLDEALRAVAALIRGELDLDGVAIALRVGARTHEAHAGEAGSGREARVLLGPGHRARWIRVVPPGPRAGARSAELRSEIRIGDATTTTGAMTLLRRAGAAPSPGETRILAVIAASLHSVAQRSELAEATTRTEVLRRADELKSALLAAVSHDLRTPLASIIASAASLRQPDVQWTDAERRAFVGDIEGEARRLARIVDNLLDLSRLESGTLRPERDWYDVGALVDDVIGRLRPLASAHRLEIDVPDDLPPVYLDRVEIDQVLSNLVENALRHTPAATTVRVTARIVDGELAVDVLDDGPGIDQRDLALLFRPFARREGAGARRGSGLGLAVARRLVEAHGGTLTAANAPRGGAWFHVSLPAGEAPAAAVTP